VYHGLNRGLSVQYVHYSLEYYLDSMKKIVIKLQIRIEKGF